MPQMFGGRVPSATVLKWSRQGESKQVIAMAELEPVRLASMLCEEFITNEYVLVHRLELGQVLAHQGVLAVS